ncbi:MAG TPA: hypothetical protein VE135_23215, partial [Pyrinomonadaceae bacterium]|nr:hypothetical protein [Pyrinomonadaceae bacterium]
VNHATVLIQTEGLNIHILQARVSMAIHFGTFALGDDGEFEPVLDLREALGDKSDSNSHFWVLDHGEGRDVP